MYRPPLLQNKSEWLAFTSSVVLAVAFAPRLPGATLITGDVTPALPWSASTSPKIGITGAGTLAVDGGSQLITELGDLGIYSGSTGTATITGVGSTWTNPALRVGGSGKGAIDVDGGGQINSFYAYLGVSNGSTGTATITGAGSTWTNSAALSVGLYGSGALTVEAGGQVSSRAGYVGYNTGSTGIATITGAGSKWVNSIVLMVGGLGSGTLTVEDGGHVTAATLYTSLGDLHGDGTIEATAGAVLDADLQFNAVHPARAILDFGAGGTLTVTAADGDLGAGYKGFGSLTIAEGVSISSSSGYMGYHPGSTGAAAITGAGSKWTNSEELYVGYSGSGALRVEAGGHVSSFTGYLGSSAGATGTATITGAQSAWTNISALYVGNSGSGSLNVEAGGQASNGFGYLGYNAGSTGTATITGAGSTWTNNGDFTVGQLGRGELIVTAGGLVSVRGKLRIDTNGGGDSYISMATGGMLALWGNADDSLSLFLGLVNGTDAIRYWDASLANWSPLTAGVLGVDYALQCQDAGDLAGYTLLTVGTLPPAGDFNLDGRVDGADLLAWQRGDSPTPNSPEDLATWRANIGLSVTTPATTAVPEPDTVSLVGVASVSLLLACRSTRGRMRYFTWGRRQPGH